jgi:FMN phosphatase YigB (HAD superfamily)
MQNIKTLIFDFGGVILDLSVETTLEQFSKLSGLGKSEVIRRFRSSHGFDNYEKGMMSDSEFRDFVRDTFGVNAADAEIDRCWNAMLIDIPLEKLELLLGLKKKYRVFLLSNTNEIHLRYINAEILTPLTGKGDLDMYFHKAYYSQRMLKRKPEPEIFQQVLDENNLVPAETLFLDDNALNIESASKLGIRTVLISTRNQIIEMFHE